MCAARRRAHARGKAHGRVDGNRCRTGSCGCLHCCFWTRLILGWRGTAFIKGGGQAVRVPVCGAPARSTRGAVCRNPPTSFPEDSNLPRERGFFASNRGSVCATIPEKSGPGGHRCPGAPRSLPVAAMVRWGGVWSGYRKGVEDLVQGVVWRMVWIMSDRMLLWRGVGPGVRADLAWSVSLQSGRRVGGVGMGAYSGSCRVGSDEERPGSTGGR